MFGTAQMKDAKPNGPVKETAKGYTRAYLVPGREGYQIVKIFTKNAAILKDDINGLIVRFKDANFVFAE
ncbi:MAG: hypothetical protein C0620_10865 [Desulfuromonas sp.]|nr:MAG: hypothetical protein C0620_10865 [Desulfuromonas sp.]